MKKFICLLAFLLGGCSGGTGTLSLELTDAATDQYQAVYVTVEEVQVHKSDAEEESWTTVATPQATYNLLEIANGVRETLGLASMEAGHYTQVRLIIGNTADDSINILSQSHPFANYVIETDGEIHKLKVPSGEQTGTKIVHEFDVNENSTTELLLDFDASKSVVVAGSSGQFLLKPTIKILNTAEASILSGTVTDESATAVEGARVMAQTYNADAADAKDEVTTEAASLSDEEGKYALFLDPASYNIVVSKAGFEPAASQVTTSAGETFTEDFVLSDTSTGELSGTVTIEGADTETFVTLSFRETREVEGQEAKIELISLNVVNGGSYTVSLPSGDYEVVAWSSGEATQSASVTVIPDVTTTHNVLF